MNDRKRPAFMPETRQFSQADQHIVQRPEGINAHGDEGIATQEVETRNLERYAELQVSPGRWDEAWPQTANPQFSGQGQVVLLEKDLGFMANTILIDNWTNQWLYLDGLKRIVPPYSGGWTLMTPKGFQQARVLARAPGGYVQPTPIAGEFVWIAWHEALLAPTTGILGPPAALTAATAVGAGTGAAITASTPEWAVVNAPAVNTQASATRAAQAGIRHVARNINAEMTAAVAPAAIAVFLFLRDGASGAGAIIWQLAGALPAVAGSIDHNRSGQMNEPGTVGNAMTLEYSAAGGANTFEMVNLAGIDLT